MDRPGVRRVLEGSREQRKMEKTDCEVICGAPTTLAVMGQVEAKKVSSERYWRGSRRWGGGGKEN